MYAWDGFNFILYLTCFIISSLEFTLLNSNESEICGLPPQFLAVGYMQVSQEEQTLNRITHKACGKRLQEPTGNQGQCSKLSSLFSNDRCRTSLIIFLALCWTFSIVLMSLVLGCPSLNRALYVQPHQFEVESKD